MGVFESVSREIERPGEARGGAGGDTLGARLRRAMHDKHLRNPALAKVTGVHVTTVSQWLNDKFEPDATNLEKLAGLLGVSAAWLRYGRGGQSAAPAEGGSGTVTISLADAMYYRGVLDTELRTLASVGASLDAMGDSLRALRGLLGGATTGLTSIANAGVLPGPNAERITSPYTAEEGIAMLNELHALGVAQMAKQEPPGGKHETPRRKRGVG